MHDEKWLKHKVSEHSYIDDNNTSVLDQESAIEFAKEYKEKSSKIEHDDDLIDAQIKRYFGDADELTYQRAKLAVMCYAEQFAAKLINMKEN